jgi:hypothetical protein
MDASAEKLSNEPIDVEGLPRLRAEAFVSVEPRHVLGTIVGCMVAAGGLLVGGIMLNNRTGRPAFLAAGIAAAAALTLSALVSLLAARRISYQVREHDLSLRSGLITRTEATVPYRRVQHVYLSRGLVERSLGLASLSVNSAGPDITVPGLPVDVATSLRAWIVERTGLDADAVVDAAAAPGSGGAETTEDGQDTAPDSDSAPPWAPPMS